MVRIGLLVTVILGTALSTGCSDDGTIDPIRDDLPAPPEGGVRLISPTFTVDAGTEVFMCMRLPFEVTEDLHVNSSVAYQVQGGHHSMLYYTTGTQPMRDEPHECDDSDMSNIRFIGVGTADGVGISLPPGLALRVPKGARIYSQSHYLNASDSPIVAQDVVDLDLLTAAELEQVAGAFTQVDLGLDLPPDEDTTRVIDCTAPREMSVPWMLPHMHEQGLRFKLEVIIDGESTTVYESDWNEALRDHFPILEFEPHLTLTTADRIRTTCTWRNTSGRRLLFPAEMCATFMPFYPSPNGALLACDENGSHFEP
jgi:hypothetical protein